MVAGSIPAGCDALTYGPLLSWKWVKSAMWILHG
jgi:hypothetical protein